MECRGSCHCECSSCGTSRKLTWIGIVDVTLGILGIVLGCCGLVADSFLAGRQDSNPPHLITSGGSSGLIVVLVDGGQRNDVDISRSRGAEGFGGSLNWAWLLTSLFIVLSLSQMSFGGLLCYLGKMRRVERRSLYPWMVFKAVGLGMTQLIFLGEFYLIHLSVGRDSRKSRLIHLLLLIASEIFLVVNVIGMWVVCEEYRRKEEGEDEENLLRNLKMEQSV